VSVLRGRISWHFSISKNNISPAASEAHIVSSVVLTNYERTHKLTKQQHDKVFQTDLIDSQKSDPPFALWVLLSAGPNW